MAYRVAGVAYLLVNSDQIPLRGNFTVSPSRVIRAGVAGQDAVHGFSELPRVPFIEGDVTLDPRLSTDALENIGGTAATGVLTPGAFTGSTFTVTAELANGHTYTLTDAWCTAAFDLNTHDGLCRVRFEGMECLELTPPNVPTTIGQGSLLQ